MECELVCATHTRGRKISKSDRRAWSRKVVPARLREHLCWDKVRGKRSEHRSMASWKLSGAVRLPRVKTKLNKSEQVTWQQDRSKNQIAEVEVLKKKVERPLTWFRDGNSEAENPVAGEFRPCTETTCEQPPAATKIGALEGLLVKKLRCEVDN